MSETKKRVISILGSTGSIGTQALDVVRKYKDELEVYALVAHRNVKKLVEQAKEFLPAVVVIADESKYEELKTELSSLPIHVWAGDESVVDVAASKEADMVLASMVGFSGLAPTIAAIKSGRTIALANKETLVVAGELIMSLSHRYRAPIIPVDSEHSAIFQCLVGETQNKISKIILTASGGPFVDFTPDQLREASASMALKHPNWSMGKKVTIDSSSMMNKGFEMIEAKWLFDIDPKDIEVLVHRQSIVHSMVQFEDATIKAQLGQPDMHIPIAYALLYPYRKSVEVQDLDLCRIGQLSFEAPRFDVFPNLSHAYRAIKEGAYAPCALNAANEIAVEKYLRNEIGFMDMSRMVESILDTDIYKCKDDLSLASLSAVDKEVRIKAKAWH